MAYDRWGWAEGELVPRYMGSQITRKAVVDHLNRADRTEKKRVTDKADYDSLEVLLKGVHGCAINGNARGADLLMNAYTNARRKYLEGT